MAAAAAASADYILKSGEVSAMIRQGFLESPTSSASRGSPRASPPPSAASPGRNHPSSPPPTTTLFDMIAEEERYHRYHHGRQHQQQGAKPPPVPLSEGQRRARLQETVAGILAGERQTSWGAGDVELTVSSSDGFSVSMNVHRGVLIARSRFFAEKLVGTRAEGASHAVEICECDDAEVYVEAVALMYCEEPRRKLVGEGVGKVLGLLKVSAAMLFDDGITSCLEHLEAAPWTDEEEEKVVALLSRLQLPRQPTSQVLGRVAVDPAASSSWADGIFLRLLGGVLQAKDEKARRELKTLLSGLLRDDAAPHDVGDDNRVGVSKETLYHLCRRCLDSLLACLSDAAGADEERRDRGALMGEIAREADNVRWLVDILVSRKAGEEFVRLWADQAELARLHGKIPCMYRFEISRVTAQLCVAMGRGQILVPREAKFALLHTWLGALYEDFAWMRRGGRTVDKKLVEEGLCRTILTLPMAQQQAILMDWFDRFLAKGDDCPNIQKAFEVWWRRAFVKQYVGEDDESSNQLQVAVCDCPAR
ncbi:hypothetical protein Taro_024550 [Colocasia esculenta]|uniref:BTB domain-containing protein n=1 Tax=Colocasia esculenta TaxID=4460 RepID=A0A843V0M4_COLES|nr:hypothetical protein [Colocasia esculenta]